MIRHQDRGPRRMDTSIWGPNTEDSPVVIETTAAKQEIVIAKVNKIMNERPRVDAPQKLDGLCSAITQASLY